MLRSHSQLQQYTVLATGSEIGMIETFMFGRGEWVIQYVVVNTGTWLDDRRILLCRTSIDGLNEKKQQMIMSLSVDQVQNSPDIDTEEPLTGQDQQELHGHYGWPTTWIRDYDELGETTAMSFEGSDDSEPDPDDIERQRLEPADMQSVNELLSYFNIQTIDEDIGTVDDVIVDDQTWSIVYLVCRLSEPAGQAALIPTDYIDRIDWTDGHIYADFEADIIRKSPLYDNTQSISSAYQKQVEDYYGQGA